MKNIILKIDALGENYSITLKPADTRGTQMPVLQKLYQLEHREKSMKDTVTVLSKFSLKI